MELTRGRVPFPTDMARVEVPYDMKQKTEMDVRGRVFFRGSKEDQQIKEKNALSSAI